MFADQQRVVLERCGAAVGQVVTLDGRTDDHELAMKIIFQPVGFAQQPLAILPEQAFHRQPQQTRVFGREPPVHEKIAVGIHGNHAFKSIRAAQNNFSAG